MRSKNEHNWFPLSIRTLIIATAKAHANEDSKNKQAVLPLAEHLFKKVSSHLSPAETLLILAADVCDGSCIFKMHQWFLKVGIISPPLT